MSTGKDKRFRLELGDIWWMLALGSFVLVVISVYEGRVESTDAYDGAVAAARGDPELIEAIGAPIHEGLFPDSEYRRTGASTGCWRIGIPVSGSEGSATVRVLYHDGPEASGYTFLVADIEGSGRRIDLLDGRRSRAIC